MEIKHRPLAWLPAIALATLLAGAVAPASEPPAEKKPRPELPAPENAPPGFAPDGPGKKISPRPAGRATGRGGNAIWIAQGPGPVLGGQIENVDPDDEVSGAIHTVVAHPTDPDLLYVGAVNGGIWRTSNAGALRPSWTPLTDDRPGLSIGALEFDPTDPSSETLIAGIGRYGSFGQFGGTLAGLLYTTDGGDNWTEIDDPSLLGENISGVAARGSVLLASSNAFIITEVLGVGGLFRSTDSGLNWALISGNGSGLPPGSVHDLVGDPGNTARFYAAVASQGIYRSDDHGASWSDISTADSTLSDVIGTAPTPPCVLGFNDCPANNNTEMAVAPNGRLYALVMLNGQTHYIGYTDDSGATVPSWTRMDLPLTPGDNLGTIGEATNASPIVVTSLTGTISDATDDDPVVITSSDHGLDSGDRVHIDGVSGNTAANGVFFISVVNSDRFSLDDSEGTGAYTGGGSWGIAHGLASGDVVEVENVLGNTAANGLFRVEVPDPRSFALDGSAGNGVYSGGGNWQEHSTLNPRFKPGAQGAIHSSIVVDPGDSDSVYVGGDRQDSPFPNFIGADDFTGRLFRGDAAVSATGQVPSPQWEHLTHDDDISEIPGGGTASSSAPHADSREMVFDADGNLIEVSDGGIYRRTSPGDNNGDWFSINGNVQVSEMHDLVYDTISNVIVGGTQDNGTVQQPVPGAIAWEHSLGGDGGDVAIDITSFSGHSIRYTSAQRMIAFRRQRFDADNILQTTDFPSLELLAGEPPVFQFVTPVELNSVDPERLIIGGYNSPYESLDQGESITELNPGQGVSVNWGAVAYGGRRQSVDNINVLWVGSFDRVFIRASASPAPLVESPGYPGGRVRDIATDPADWTIAYVLDDDNDRIYRTVDAGANWTDVTGNLDDTLLTLIYMPSGVDKLVTGGFGGVSAMRIDSPGVWNPLGNGLPGAPVMELDFDAEDDRLVAATMGRGAWMLESATCAGASNDDDGDTICNGSDNCPDDPNLEQDDLDLDGFGDACDCEPADPAINPGAPEIADDGIDQDCNGADTISCYIDTDRDGFGDSAGSVTLAADGNCDLAEGESEVAGDCDDSNASVWQLPGAVGELTFTDKATLFWSPPAETGGQPGSLRYDVIRSGNPADFSTGASCVESNDGSDSTAIAAAIPAAGNLDAYLVRPENPCGEGPTGNSSLGPRPDARACAAMAYVTNSGDGTVSVIDLGTVTVTQVIDVPGTPLGVAISSDGARAYVTLSGETDPFDAAVIDTTGQTVVDTVAGDRFGAAGVAVSPDGSTVYLSRQFADSVRVVDTATSQITAEVPVGTTPQFLAIKPDGSVVYVPNASSSSISVIATGSNTVIESIAVGNGAYAVAFSADGSTAYVSNTGSATVSVIDTSTHAVTDTIPVGSSPQQLAVAPDGAKLYVSVEFGDVNVVDTALGTVVGSVHVSGTPDGISITPDGKFAYVASSIGEGAGGFITVFDLATEFVVNSFPAARPVSIAMTP